MTPLIYVVVGVVLIAGGLFIFRRDHSTVGSKMVGPAMSLVGVLMLVLGLRALLTA